MGTDTYSFTVETPRLVGQCSLEDLVDPRLLRLLSSFTFTSSSSLTSSPSTCTSSPSPSVLHQLPILLSLLALLLLEQVCDGVEEVVEELVGVLLHVVVKQL